MNEVFQDVSRGVEADRHADRSHHSQALPRDTQAVGNMTLDDLELWDEYLDREAAMCAAMRREWLQRAADAGLYKAEVSEILGISRTYLGIISDLYFVTFRKGEARRPHKFCRKAMVRGLKSGATRAQMARRLGVSPAAITRACQELGL